MTPTETTTPRRAERLRRAAGAAAALCVLTAALAAVFSDVLFDERTLLASPVELGVTGRPPHAGYPGDDPPERSPFLLDTLAPAVISEPVARHAHDLLVNGDLPLWNDRVAVGQPLLASAEPQIVNPLRLPLAIDPSPLTWDLFLVGRLLLAGACTFFLARSLGLGAPASLAASLAYALAGYTQLHVNTVHADAAALLPALMLGVELVVRRPRGVRIAGAAFVVGCTALADNPQSTVFALTMATGFAVVRAIAVGASEGRRGFRAVAALSALGLGIALTAVTYLPFLELSGALLYAGESINFHTPTDLVGARHAPPFAFVTLLLPWVYGPPLDTFGGGGRHDLMSYVGVAVPTLAALGLAARRSQLRFGAFFLVWAVLGTAKIFGWSPLDGIGRLPVFEVASFVVYVPPTVNLALAILAGIGVQRVSDGGVRWWEPVLVVAALWAALGWLVELSGAPADTPDAVLALNTGLARPVLAAVVALVVLAGLPRVNARLPVVALALLVGVELWAWALPIQGRTAVADALYPDGEAVQRPLRADAFALPPALAEVGDDLKRARVVGDDAALYPNTAQALGLSDVRGHSALTLERYVRFVQEFLDPFVSQRFTGLGWSPFVSGGGLGTREKHDALSLLGVRYVVSQSDDEVPLHAAQARGYRLAAEAEGLRVWENPAVLPHAFLVHTVEPAADVDEAVARTRALLDDAGTRAVVEGMTRGMRIGLEGSAPRPGDSVEIVARSPNRLVVDVTTADAAMLVVADSFYPGWNATVSGRATPVLPTDVMLRGVYVPPGSHRVEMAFTSTTVRLGATITTLAALALAGLVAASVGHSAGRLLAPAAWRRWRSQEPDATDAGEETEEPAPPRRVPPPRQAPKRPAESPDPAPPVPVGVTAGQARHTAAGGNGGAPADNGVTRHRLVMVPDDQVEELVTAGSQRQQADEAPPDDAPAAAAAGDEPHQGERGTDVAPTWEELSAAWSRRLEEARAEVRGLRAVAERALSGDDGEPRTPHKRGR